MLGVSPASGSSHWPHPTSRQRALGILTNQRVHALGIDYEKKKWAHEKQAEKNEHNIVVTVFILNLKYSARDGAAGVRVLG